MLTTRPHLTAIRPSPTTVSYTVSTASPQDTLASAALHPALLVLRLVMGIATAFILFIKLFNVSFDGLETFATFIHDQPWSHVAGLGFASFFLVFRRYHTGMAYHSTSASFIRADRWPRGIAPRPAHLRDSDSNTIRILPPTVYSALYTYITNSGYFHT